MAGDVDPQSPTNAHSNSADPSDASTTGSHIGGGLLRHSAGFLASGIISLLVDMGVTSLMMRGFGLSPFTARVAGIGVAMVAAWQSHRHLTFAVATPSTLTEFLKFAAVASTSVVVNYLLYALVLVLNPNMAPELALVISSLGSMFVTYFGMRFGVFRR
ncbi:MAG: GtrA family protein [Hyphomicrobium aestuarii]|nr:GtrA family protein [Hyphomicrobium aestuarii]